MKAWTTAVLYGTVELDWRCFGIEEIQRPPAEIANCNGESGACLGWVSIALVFSSYWPLIWMQLPFFGRLSALIPPCWTNGVTSDHLPYFIPPTSRLYLAGSRVMKGSCRLSFTPRSFSLSLFIRLFVCQCNKRRGVPLFCFRWTIQYHDSYSSPSLFIIFRLLGIDAFAATVNKTHPR